MSFEQKKSFFKSIRKTLSKFWNHWRKSRIYQNIRSRKFFQTLGTYLEKPAQKILLNFWSIS